MNMRTENRNRIAKCLVKEIMFRYCSFSLLLFFSINLFAQNKLISDDEAREIAVAAVKKEISESCVRTRRNEDLEDTLFGLRTEKIRDGKLNRSVYFYALDDVRCEEVVNENTLRLRIVDHERSFGYIAVDRVNKKTYWFRSGLHDGQAFSQFIRDFPVRITDDYDAKSVASLYIQLIRGPYSENEIYDETQLQRIVEDNFASAYSPYRRDKKWEAQFNKWWKEFLGINPDLIFNTITEKAQDGILVYGLSFQGFELRIPREDPPPKGVPTLWRWALLVKSDGTVEKRESKVVYSKR
jgi:hypothetical protein